VTGIDAQAATADVNGLVHVHSGKVRDLYSTPDGRLVMVASDRISAFDFILETVIPDKGAVLTALTEWWFERLADLVPNHLISTTDPVIPVEWRGRAMLCQPLDMIPVEAVARGYLTGSGFIDYTRTGAVCGVELAPGLRDGDRLPQPIFTPASKADLGEHDENVTYETVAAGQGEPTAAELRRLTLTIYGRAAEIAAERGILLADTKFEFGRARAVGSAPSDDREPGALILGDEVLTPDSSRFWPAEEWSPGQPQASYDKQYVRDWLLSAASGWDRHGDAPPPPLPTAVVEQTRQRYVQAYERLTGRRFANH
jgi:phosphoribosylaminoimidazole-succinocarboxamide synthase